MKTIICLILCSLLTGCVASISKNFEDKNIIELKANAEKLAQLSPFQIAYLQAAIGNDSGRLPAEAVQCLDNILLTVTTAQTENRAFTDAELGAIAGKWDRFVFLIGPDAILWIVNLLRTL